MTFERRYKDNTQNAVLQGRLSKKVSKVMDDCPYYDNKVLIVRKV